MQIKSNLYLDTFSDSVSAESPIKINGKFYYRYDEFLEAANQIVKVPKDEIESTCFYDRCEIVDELCEIYNIHEDFIKNSIDFDTLIKNSKLFHVINIENENYYFYI